MNRFLIGTSLLLLLVTPCHASGPTSISTDRLRLSFSYITSGPQNVGIRLDSIEHIDPTDPNTILYSADSSSSPLWQVTFRNLPSTLDPDDPNCIPNYSQIRVPAELRYSYCTGAPDIGGYPMEQPQAASAQILCQPNGLDLVWTDVSIPNSCPSTSQQTFDVTVKLRTETVFSSRQFITWSIEAALDQKPKNCVEDWHIYHVRTPILFLPQIGSSRQDDFFLFPYTHGVRINDPITNRNTKNEEGADAVFDSGRTVRQFTYPGHVYSQFMAYYDDSVEGASADTTQSGLLLAADDPEGFLKRLYFGSVVGESSPGVPDPNTTTHLFMYFTHFREGDNYTDFLSFDLESLRAKSTVSANCAAQLGYKVFFDSFQGDWYDAAQVYRSWMIESATGSTGFLRKGTLRSRAIVNSHFADALETTHSVAYNVDPNRTVNAQATDLRKWSEYFTWSGGHGEGDPCAFASVTLDGPGTRPPGVMGLCTDTELVCITAIGKSLNRLMRIPLSQGGQTAGPLFRWSFGRSDAGNFNEERLDPSERAEYRLRGLPHLWSGRILRAASLPAMDCKETTLINGISSSASLWLREEKRRPRWRDYFLQTNCTNGLCDSQPDPNIPFVTCHDPNDCNSLVVPAPTQSTDPLTCDWIGINGIVFTGSATSAMLDFAPLFANTRRSHPAGGGTHWMNRYRNFVEDVKCQIYSLSQEEDHLQFLVLTERAHEQIIPVGGLAGKYRSFPYDHTMLDKNAWLVTNATQAIPLSAVLYHDYAAIVGEVPVRSDTIQQYYDPNDPSNLQDYFPATCGFAWTPGTGDPNALSAQQMESFRFRMRVARYILDGVIPGMRFVGDPDDERLAFDGPPDPTIVSSVVLNDYAYARMLMTARVHFKQFLVYGQMIRRPRILLSDPLSTRCDLPVARFKVRDDGCVDCPEPWTEKAGSDALIARVNEVYGTAWRNNDLGVVGFFFTNHASALPGGNCSDSNPNLAFRFEINSDELGLDPGIQYEFAKVEVSCEPGAKPNDPPVPSYSVSAFPAAGCFTPSPTPFQSGEITLARGELLFIYPRPKAMQKQ